MNEEKFVTIAMFDMPGVVKIYQEALAQEGIESFVPNDYAPFDGQFYYKPNPMDRGIKLQVEERYVEGAVKLLSEDPACRKYIIFREYMTEDERKSIEQEPPTNYRKWLKFRAYYFLIFLGLALIGFIITFIDELIKYIFWR